jgi:asparagine synthase (glutamine-hydrolysing)
MYEDDEICAAIAGYPVFSEPKLENLAIEQGTAKALFESYKKYGVRAPNFMGGNFCVAVMHKKEEKAFLAVDRLGIRSLTYTRVNGGLVFGSTATAIKEHPRVKTSVDPQMIFDYLYFHVVPTPGSIYSGLSRLPPGGYALFCNGKVTTGSYWQLEYREATSSSFKELKHEFLDVLEQSVRRTITCKNIGAFLSGGTDSSTVVGMLGQVTGTPARTYSIGFDAPGYDELDYARITAKHFGTQHHEYYVRPDDVVAAVPLIAATYDDPYGNASAVPTYYCARLAKEDGTDKLLAGDGGDELFGGNARYAKQWVFSLYGRLLPEMVRQRIIEPVMLDLVRDTKLWPVRKFRSYVQQASVPMPERLQTYNLLWRIGVENIFTDEFLQQVDSAQPTMLLRRWYANVHAADTLNRMLGLDLKITLSDNDLPKVTKMCEVAGVEVDFPFLDDELVAFSAKLRPRDKVRGTRLRYFFKKALRDLLPDETLAKTKHGFGLPFGLWLQKHKPLRELANDSLHDLSSRRILQPRFVSALTGELLRLHAPYYGTMIWILVMLEQWFRQHDH